MKLFGPLPRAAVNALGSGVWDGFGPETNVPSRKSAMSPVTSGLRFAISAHAVANFAAWSPPLQTVLLPLHQISIFRPADVGISELKRRRARASTSSSSTVNPWFTRMFPAASASFPAIRVRFPTCQGSAPVTRTVTSPPSVPLNAVCALAVPSRTIAPSAGLTMLPVP